MSRQDYFFRSKEAESWLTIQCLYLGSRLIEYFYADQGNNRTSNVKFNEKLLRYKLGQRMSQPLPHQSPGASSELHVHPFAWSLGRLLMS